MSAVQWRPIDGFPGYEVSEFGEVRRYGRIKTQMSDRKGYLKVGLWIGGESNTRYVSRLVAAAFIGLRPDGHQVRHKNGIKTSNHFNNLEYGTPVENEHDKRAHGTAPIGTNHPAAKLNEAQVLAIRTRYKPYIRKDGFNALGAEFGVSGAMVLRIVKRIAWKHLP
jgi:hypothetical protein